MRKRMKKLMSVLLAAVMVTTLLTSSQAGAVKKKYTSTDVKSVQITKQPILTERYVGRYQVNYSEIPGMEITITLQDNTTAVINMDEFQCYSMNSDMNIHRYQIADYLLDKQGLSEDFEIYVNLNSDFTNDVVGTYTNSVSVGDKSAEFTLSCKESPVKSIEFAPEQDEIKVYEAFKNQSFSGKYYDNYEAEKLIVTFKEGTGYPTEPITIDISMGSGWANNGEVSADFLQNENATKLGITNYDEDNYDTRMQYGFFFQHTQETTPWTAGNTEYVTLNFLGKTLSYPVTVVKEAKASSIRVAKAPKVDTYYKDCQGQSFSLEGLELEVTSSEGTVTLSGDDFDGESAQKVGDTGVSYTLGSAHGDAWRGKKVNFTYDKDVIGKKIMDAPVTVTVDDATTGYDLHCVESPVASIVAHPVRPIQFKESDYRKEEYYDSDTHKWIEYKEYSGFSAVCCLSIDVTYRDGTSKQINVSKMCACGNSSIFCFDYQGDDYDSHDDYPLDQRIYIEDTQRESSWSVGNQYDMTISYMGAKASFPISIVKDDAGMATPYPTTPTPVPTAAPTSAPTPTQEPTQAPAATNAPAPTEAPKKSVKKRVATPKVNKIAKKAKKITGKAAKGSTVMIQIGSKVFRVSCKKGTFSLRLSSKYRKRLKKGVKVKVTAKKNGYLVSLVKTVKVK